MTERFWDPESEPVPTGRLRYLGWTLQQEWSVPPDEADHSTAGVRDWRREWRDVPQASDPSLPTLPPCEA
jgi:hypothetical protein